MIFLVLGAFIAGCAGDKATKKDAFLEKWKTMAEKSRGYSPSPIVKDIKISEGRPGSGRPSDLKEGVDVAHLKLFPTDNVKLNLRKSDVKAVLLSLGRTVNLNMLVRADIKGEINVEFNNIPWDQAFNSILRSQGLTYEWEGDVLQIMTVEDLKHDLELATIKEQRNAMRMEAKLVEPLLDIMIEIDYADARSLAENLEGLLTRGKDTEPRGMVRVDEHSNSLLIQAVRGDLTRIIELVKKIDKPIHQIRIDANIVEATKDTALALGVQWGGALRKGELLVSPGGSLELQQQQQGTGGTGGTGGSGGSGQNLSPPVKTGNVLGTILPPFGTTGLSGRGFGSNFPITDIFGGAGASGSIGFLFGSIDGNILDFQLHSLQEEGKLNILSSPSITTMDNQMAFTENGETVPYITQEPTETGGAIEQNVEFVDAVLRLEITPHVIGEDKLKMKILVQKDEVDFTRQVQGNPLITRKLTETTLIVRNGETIVISGLTKNRTVDLKEGIPVLRDLPVLGKLFRSKNNRETMEEVLVFITPHILPTEMMAKAQEGLDKGIIQERAVQDKLDEALRDEGLDKSVVQDKPEEPEVQERLKKTVIREGKEESIVQEEIEKPIFPEQAPLSQVEYD